MESSTYERMGLVFVDGRLEVRIYQVGQEIVAQWEMGRVQKEEKEVVFDENQTIGI